MRDFRLIFTPSASALRLCLAGLLVVLWQPAGQAADSIRCKLADGFDFPVGKPDGDGYYKARGFYPNGHLGEDWNGTGGGDSDLGAPINATASGVVVYSANRALGWGHCIIIRHVFRDEGGKIAVVDSLYGHLLERKVELYQMVERGQLIGKMGSNFGMYPAHLHFEIHKNLTMGMTRTNFAHDYSNYYSPTQFINARRTLDASFAKVEVAVNTFVQESKSPGEFDGPGLSRGLSIPVYRGTSPKAGATAKPNPLSRIQQEAQARSAAVSSASSGGDFWSRIKSKVSNGSLMDSNPLKH